MKNIIIKVLGSLESARLDEMARIGFINGQYEVYVWTDDAGYIPHVHIRDANTKGKEFETCVMLEDNQYFLHGSYTDIMNYAMRKSFYEFMISPCKNLKYQNNYEYAVNMWNDNNSNKDITPQYDEYGHIIVPDYRKM